MYYRGRSAQVAQAQVKAAVSSAPAVLAALPVSHQGVPSGAASISAPRLAVVKVSGSIPAAPFSNSQYIEFQLPKSTVGLVTDCDLELTMDFSTSDGDGVDITVPPTPFLLQRLEIVIGSNVVETNEDHELWLENCVWRHTDDQAANANSWNCTSALAVAPSFNVASGTTVRKTWLVPFGRGNFLFPANPYLKGLGATSLALRCYFTSSPTITVFQSGSSTPSTCTVALPNAQLYLTEAALSAEAEASLAAKYARGVKLPTVLRKKAPSLPFTSLSNASPTQIQLQSFQGAGATAALLVYVEPIAPTVPDRIRHKEIASWSMNDAGNTQMIINTPESLILKEQSKQLPVSTGAITNPSHSYVLPFCSNLGSVLEGHYAKHFRLTGQESILITPVSSETNVRTQFVAYQYAEATAAGGLLNVAARS